MKKYLVVAALMLAPTVAQTADPPHPVRVYILAGQSNMEGKAKVSLAEYQAEQPATRELYAPFRKGGKWAERDDVWVKFLDRKGKFTAGYGSPGCIGPELGFGAVVGDHHAAPVLLIKTAWGGRSLYRDFRPPSAGLPADEVLEKMLAEQKKRKPDATLEDVKKQFGASYRAMLEEVKDTLGSLKDHFPDYAGQGYELAGFVWFQGWNDMIDAGYTTEYTTNLTHFIRDVRRDLKTPKLPFVVGQMGVDGESPGANVKKFKAAQAAVLDVAEFRGNVALVKTDAFWDKAAEAVFRKGWRENLEEWNKVGSDYPSHYLGSARTVLAIGRAFGKAVLQLSDPTRPPRKYDLDAIDAYLAAQVKKNGFIGLSVAIMRDGKIVFARGYGHRSVEKQLPVEPDSSFAVGSITKQFTCACVLILAEEGKLSIDDPVAKYFPHLTRARDVTVRDLMNHTAGYPDYYPLDFVDRRMRKPIALDAMLKEYACGKLDFEPGSRFSYSNTGYIVLGGIVEKASGEPFGTFLERRILKPLKMDHSRYEKPSELPLRATGYTAFALGEPEPVEPEADGWIGAAGGLWASAADLLRWDLALVEGRVLKPESYRTMTAPRTLSSGKRSDYGCGLGVPVIDGEPVLRHGGGVSGFVSLNAFLPRVRSGLVVLSNAEHVSAEPIRSTLFRLLLEDVQERESPAVPKVAGPGPKEAVLEFLQQMTEGTVDRAKLGEEFSAYLTDERVKAGGARLKALGAPTRVEVDPVHERGGMEVASVMLIFETARVRASLYRTPDGKIQQLLFYGAGVSVPSEE